MGPASDTLTVFQCPTAGGSCMPIAIPLQGSGVAVLAITTATLPSGTFGTPYPATTLQATGGVGPYAWSVSGGSLPAGLTLEAATGRISGTPTAAGTFNFTVRVTDSGTPTPQTASKSFSIKIQGVADLALSIAAPEKPVNHPKPITFTIAVKDLGPTNATSVIVTSPLPSGSRFINADTSQGSCTTPPVGSTGTMVCSLGYLANGATATISVTRGTSFSLRATSP